MIAVKTVKKLSAGTVAAVSLLVMGAAPVGATQNNEQSMNHMSSSSMHMTMQDHSQMRMMWADNMMSEMHMTHQETMRQMEMHMSGWDSSKRAGFDTKIHEIMAEHKMHMEKAIVEYKMHIQQGMNHDEARNMLINKLDSSKAHAMNKMFEARNHWIDWANNRSGGMVSGEEKDKFVDSFNRTMDWHSNKHEHIKNNQ